MKKRTYKILLRSKEDQFVRAQRYRREAEQYVFESDGDDEVQFFDASDVVGVFVIEDEQFQSEGGGAY